MPDIELRGKQQFDQHRVFLDLRHRQGQRVGIVDILQPQLIFQIVFADHALTRKLIPNAMVMIAATASQSCLVSDMTFP